MKNKFRVVLDTNIIISSWLGNKSSPNAEILRHFENNLFTLLYTDDIISEYMEKLFEFGVSEEDIIEFVSFIMLLGNNVKIDFFHLPIYPKDQDDIAFILCAKNGNADYLVSYDDHLLILNGIYNFKIYLPLDFLFEFRK